MPSCDMLVVFISRSTYCGLISSLLKGGGLNQVVCTTNNWPVWIIMFRWLLLLSVLCAICAHRCPNIIRREQWGAQPPRCIHGLRTPVPQVLIIHTAGAFCFSADTCRAQMRNVQHYHRNVKGWCDIGYNFLIGEDGRVYEGRGWRTLGTHSGEHNGRSIAISFMGNFMGRAPNMAALSAAQKLISCGVAKHHIKRSYVLKGHRDVNPTLSPGDALYRVIRKWPHYKA
ncbi:peptidoglycan recognition protein 1-like [Gastrophryne carolinensis]